MLLFNKTICAVHGRIFVVLLALCSSLLLVGGASAKCNPMNITGSSPTFNSTIGNRVTPPLSVTFNFNIDPSSVIAGSNVRLINYNTGANIPITTAVSGNTIYIKPIGILPLNSYFRYTVSAGIRGRPVFCAFTIGYIPVFVGNYGNNFYTGAGCIAMYVENTSPPGIELTVNSLSPLSVTFNYTVDPTSVTNSSVSLTDLGSGANVPVTVTVSGKTLSIKPVSTLPPNSHFRITVMTGIRGIDVNCPSIVFNEYGNYVFNFYTGKACGGSYTFVPAALNLTRGCRYDVTYQHDPIPNTDGNDQSQTVWLGSWVMYSLTALADHEYGMQIQMTDVHFDSARNAWVATTVTKEGFEFGYSLGAEQSSNIGVAPGDYISYAVRVFDPYTGQDNPYYTTGYPNSSGVGGYGVAIEK